MGELFGLEHISTGLFLNGLKSYSQMKREFKEFLALAVFMFGFGR